MSDDSSDSTTPASPDCERSRAAIKQFSMLKHALVTGNQVHDALAILMRQSYGSSNSALLNRYLLITMNSTELSIQIRSLYAISLLYVWTPENLDCLAPLLMNRLQNDAIKLHILRCMSPVITRSVYNRVFCSYCQREIECGTDRDVLRLLLHLTYCVYRKDRSVIGTLFTLAKKCIFDSPMNALGVLLEITYDYPELVLGLIEMLLLCMNDASSFCFSKLCKIMLKLLPLDMSQADNVKKVLWKIFKTDRKLSAQYYMTSVELVAFLNDQELIETIGAKMERILAMTSNPNDFYMMLTGFTKIQKTYKLSDRTMRRFLSSGDPIIRALSYELFTPTMEKLQQIVAELISAQYIEASAYFVDLALRIAPKVGSWFVTLLFALHETPKTAPVLRSVMSAIEDRNMRKLFVGEVKWVMKDLPDDEFGIALAECISDVTKDSSDLQILVPLKIQAKSRMFQSAMLDCATLLIMRMETGLDTGIRNRIESLCYSNFRDVRLKAAELLVISDIMSQSI